jgi:steroid delta-isomerase-like uncharacterized protein
MDFSSEKKMFTAELKRAPRLLSSFSRNNPLLEDFREAPSRRPSPRVEEGAAMTSEQNKTIVRRAFEEPWKGNLDVIDELIATQYIGHDSANPEPLRGPAGVKEFISTYRAAFPDARITVEQQLAEGDLVATRWTGRGTHDGELMGITATGERVTVSGLTISRLEGGKIVEEFQNWDTFGMMQQLGAVPALAQV